MSPTGHAMRIGVAAIDLVDDDDRLQAEPPDETAVHQTRRESHPQPRQDDHRVEDGQPGLERLHVPPEQAEIGHGFRKLFKFYGLYHVGVYAKFIARYQVLLLARGGHHHYRDVSGPFIRLDALQHLAARHLRHRQIDQRRRHVVTLLQQGESFRT